MRVLFVDCCTKEGGASKTRQLCRIFLDEVKRLHPEYEVETLVLKEKKLVPLEETDIVRRNALIRAGETGDCMFDHARQFADAERIVAAAPYWDLSFPSMLKVYIEHIFVNGIAFAYEGPRAVGRCSAEKFMYIQTAGGFVGENEPGSMYLKAVCKMLGIPEFQYICAEGMDIQEIDREQQWRTAVEETVKAAQQW
ncbi:NAD(P)H-dependent oxidoreductase [[Clostridium] hylemonae]|uniref:NAD(P)H-dependent oxidoreductase n=1 Tax=[Clostridium] hylemonae TaxID=89153 RepID=UPI001486D93B|nr:NAD(P)H-dependent oxidoreductase [[Clostridium] hylemonae]